MGVLKEQEGSGGARFEVIEPVTPFQLMKLGEVEPGTVIYDAETKKKVSENAELRPGRSFGTTVQAEYGKE
jgi:hypothetical protein